MNSVKSKAESQIDYIIKTTWQNIYSMYDAHAERFEGTVATAFALLSINPIDGSLSSEIGPRMGIASTSISRILNTLEERKLIKKYPNKKDGRSVIIKLTAKGKKMRDISKQTILGFNEMLAEALTPNEQNQFYDIMKKINTVAEKYKKYE